MSTSDQADSLAAARAEVEQAREELGETVEALAYKADVKARAHDKADELRERAQATAQQVQARAQEAAQKLQAKAQQTAAEAQARGGTLAEPTAVAAPPAPPTPQEEVQAGRRPARSSCSRGSSSFHRRRSPASWAARPSSGVRHRALAWRVVTHDTRRAPAPTAAAAAPGARW